MQAHLRGHKKMQFSEGLLHNVINVSKVYWSGKLINREPMTGFKLPVLFCMQRFILRSNRSVELPQIAEHSLLTVLIDCMPNSYVMK